MNEFKGITGPSLPKIGREALEHAGTTLRSNPSKKARSAAGSLMVTKRNLDRLELKLLPCIQSIREQIALIGSLDTMRRIAFIGSSKSKMRRITFIGSSNIGSSKSKMRQIIFVGSSKSKK